MGRGALSPGAPGRKGTCHVTYHIASSIGNFSARPVRAELFRSAEVQVGRGAAAVVAAESADLPGTRDLHRADPADDGIAAGDAATGAARAGSAGAGSVRRAGGFLGGAIVDAVVPL